MYKILRKELLAPNIYRMDIEAPRVAHSAKPGQFIILRLDEAGDACEFAIVCEKEEAAERTRRAENGYENQKYRLHLHGHLPVPR